MARGGTELGAAHLLHIRILIDIIEDMSRSAPALAPLFRSDQQLRILAVLFADSEDELSIHDLACKPG